MLALLASPIARKIIGGIIILGIIFYAVGVYNNSIRDKQKLEDRNVQLEQLNEDMIDLQNSLNHLSTKNDEIIQELNNSNQTVIERQNTVREYLTSPAAQQNNTEAPDVIKNTIRILREEETTSE